MKKPLSQLVKFHLGIAVPVWVDIFLETEVKYG